MHEVVLELAIFINAIWASYGNIIMILLLAISILIWANQMYDAFKPGKENQKAVWTCPECKLTGTMYFREYGHGSAWSIGAQHIDVSPFCDGKGFSVEFSDMSAAEIQQQNKSARERIER
jgi:hypothetical protein